MGMALLEKADGKGKSSRGAYHRHLKRYKVRIERHAANRDPEIAPTYRRHRGYET